VHNDKDTHIWAVLTDNCCLGLIFVLRLCLKLGPVCVGLVFCLFVCFLCIFPLVIMCELSLPLQLIASSPKWFVYVLSLTLNLLYHPFYWWSNEMGLCFSKLVLPGSWARIVRCGGCYDPQLVKRSSEWVSDTIPHHCAALHDSYIAITCETEIQLSVVNIVFFVCY